MIGRARRSARAGSLGEGSNFRERRVSANSAKRGPVSNSTARAERRALSGALPKPRRRAIVWAVHPRPVFGAFAQASPDWIHEDVADLLLLLMMIEQAVIEKVSLPLDLLVRRQKVFPVRHRFLHARLARERDVA